MVECAEELEHLIGSETTRQGVMLVFNMFQQPRLNRRLAYVIAEGVLETIFTDRCFAETFRRIHAQSPRVTHHHHHHHHHRTAGSGAESKSTARK